MFDLIERILRDGGRGPTRREFLAAAGLTLASVGCGGPYAMPTRAGRGGAGATLPMARHDYFERDVSALLPDGLTGRYYFGGGFLGKDGIEPQSVLVELDAEAGLARRAAYTYAPRRGQPLTDLGGEDARAVLDVVRRIGGRIHKVVAAPERQEIYLFPAAGAPAVVDMETLALRSSFGARVFYADNFSAHPFYDPGEGALYYTRLDVIDNMSASLAGEPERYVHSLVRRELATGEERVLLEGVVGTIVHAVDRSPDGRTGVIVFTGDGIRRPFGRRGDGADHRRRSQRTAASSRVVLFDWRQMRIYGEVKTAAVPVHVEFERVEGGRGGLFVQCVNTTFVDSPPSWYGHGAYQKLSIAEGAVGVDAQFDDASYCNVPHSLRMADGGETLWSTNAESRCVLGLDPASLEVTAAVPFEPLSAGHDQSPRGIEQSVDGRYLLISSNTSIHFYDLKKRAWAGRPIGLVIGERHAHASRVG